MKKKLCFNNKKYLKIQSEEILKRIAKFDDKLYLEFGGKLFDDYHASRVLPGFLPDSKLRMLLTIKNKVEIVIVVNTTDIKNQKVRNDIGITYENEVERLIDAFHEADLYVGSVVLSFYEDSPIVENFITKLNNYGVKVYKHYKIAGYPQSIPLIVSEEGLGKNEYIQTTRPLVVITAPGPGSGKMATALSQLYHDNKNGIHAGYAKYETFPIWNIPLDHPVNLAYEAATADLKDVNMIDPFHLSAYGTLAVNYNRDIETFPLLKAIFEKIHGTCPYQSPTDMGVNMAGFAIENDEAARIASTNEVIRRYYQTKKLHFLGSFDDESVAKVEILMNRLNVTPLDRKCVLPCLKKQEKTGELVVSIELPNHKVVTGKRSQLLSASSAALLNSLKVLAKIDDSIPLLSRKVIEPIKQIKEGALKQHNARIRAEEILVALAIQASNNPLADLALQQLPKLRGCQAHSSHILTEVEAKTFKKLGIDMTEEAVSYAQKIYVKERD